MDFEFPLFRKFEVCGDYGNTYVFYRYDWTENGLRCIEVNLSEEFSEKITGADIEFKHYLPEEKNIHGEDEILEELQRRGE